GARNARRLPGDARLLRHPSPPRPARVARLRPGCQRRGVGPGGVLRAGRHLAHPVAAQLRGGHRPQGGWLAGQDRGRPPGRRGRRDRLRGREAPRDARDRPARRRLCGDPRGHRHRVRGEAPHPARLPLRRRRRNRARGRLDGLAQRHGGTEV
ncbi:MAG: hypothetical protein AVDCRST_MAG68-925, partial [uncultured Gemmatimonadetes bacterium]